MMCDVVTSSGSREGAWAYIAFKAYTPSRLPLEVTPSHALSSILDYFYSSILTSFPLL
jgi:hypothetical protein